MDGQGLAVLKFHAEGAAVFRQHGVVHGDDGPAATPVPGQLQSPAHVDHPGHAVGDQLPGAEGVGVIVAVIGKVQIGRGTEAQGFVVGGESGGKSGEGVQRLPVGEEELAAVHGQLRRLFEHHIAGGTALPVAVQVAVPCVFKGLGIPHLGPVVFLPPDHAVVPGRARLVHCLEGGQVLPAVVQVEGARIVSGGEAGHVQRPEHLVTAAGIAELAIEFFVKGVQVGEQGPPFIHIPQRPLKTTADGSAPAVLGQGGDAADAHHGHRLSVEILGIGQRGEIRRHFPGFRECGPGLLPEFFRPVAGFVDHFPGKGFRIGDIRPLGEREFKRQGEEAPGFRQLVQPDFSRGKHMLSAFPVSVFLYFSTPPPPGQVFFVRRRSG